MNITIAENERGLLQGVGGHFAQYTGPLAMVLDIGAHVGELALMAVNRGAREVWAIEPDPDNYRLLVHNIKQNGCENVIYPLPVAVWAYHGAAAIKSVNGGGNSGMKSILYRQEAVDHESPVTTVSLESLLLKAGAVDYLKLDIEGAEHWVIPATPIHLLRQIHALDLDVHDMSDQRFFNIADYDPERLRRHLAQAGFVVPAGLVNGHAGILLREERP